MIINSFLDDRFAKAEDSPLHFLFIQNHFSNVSVSHKDSISSSDFMTSPTPHSVHDVFLFLQICSCTRINTFLE